MARPFGVLVLLTVSTTALAGGSLRPRVIYGEDDRRDYFEITDSETRVQAEATVALMRAANLTEAGPITDIHTVPFGTGLGLCTDEPFYAQETAAFCSGFLVSADVIVTAGHCIRSQDTCAQTRFVFGFRVGTKDQMPRQVPSENVYTCGQLIHSVADPQGEDFAVIRLSRPVTHVKPLTLRRSGRPNVGAYLTVIGHPSGLPLKIAGGGVVRALQNSFFTTNLDTYGGNSGSAVLGNADGHVEGILVRGEMDFDYVNGCRVSKRCPADGCRGEDVTLIERVLPYLNP